MNKQKFFSTAIVLVTVLGLLLSACAAPAQPAQPTQAGQPPASGEVVTIRMAVLPILDALPMYVAQQEGLFAKHGVKLEFIPAASAAERDQVIIAGQADGMINEIIATLLYNKDQIQVQIVRLARTATSQYPEYRILASGKSDITTPEQLKGVEIGISQGTIIEYITERLLQKEGLSKDEIKTIAVPKIDARMSLLGTGELKAATMPDPLASVSILQGARVVLDDTKHPEYSHSTYAFRKAFIDEHPEAIRGFLAAIEEAVQMINADRAKWNNLLGEQKLVPEPLLKSFEVPEFVTAGVPDEALWNDVMAWEKEKGLISADVSYKDSVNASFLP